METDDKVLKNQREKTYPAYVNRVSGLLDIPPYFLMPLWSACESKIDDEIKSGMVSGLSRYIRIVKEFREELISKDVTTMDKIKRGVYASDTTAKDN